MNIHNQHILCVEFQRAVLDLPSIMLLKTFAALLLPPIAFAVQVMEARDVARTLWQKHDLFETDVHAIIRCHALEEKPRYRLMYMPCRNRGEILRLMLEEAQCPYELEVVGFEPWREYVKATTPHGKLPVLHDLTGKNLCEPLGQEGAITRHLAMQLGLAGRTAAEQAAVDSLYCFWFATLRNNGVSHDGEHYSVASLKELRTKGGCEDALAALRRPRYQDVFRQNDLSRAERSLVALRYFEETLERAGTGFLVADAPTYADLGLFYVLFELAEEDNVPDFAHVFGFPRLGAFLEAMQQRAQIRDYLASPRRMPRYQRAADGASLYTYLPGKLSPEVR